MPYATPIETAREKLSGLIQPVAQGAPVYLTESEVDALSDAQLARYIDHTLLKPDAGRLPFEKLCAEAREFKCASVCVQPCRIALCVKLLEGSGVPACTVIGFPQGCNTRETKAAEARLAVEAGADELDMVLNVGLLMDANYAAVRADVAAVVEAAQGTPVKVILETVFLTDEEKVIASLLCQSAGAAFVKTSTGFNGGGATVEDIALMRAAVGPSMGVKASGGVRDGAAARAMLKAGANRIGTSSMVAIVGGGPVGAEY